MQIYENTPGLVSGVDTDGMGRLGNQPKGF